MFEEAAGKSSGMLASEVIEIDVAEGEEGDESEEEEEKKPSAERRKAQRGGWSGGVHGRSLARNGWRDKAKGQGRWCGLLAGGGVTDSAYVGR